MAATTLTTVAYVFKDLFDGDITNMATRTKPLLDMMPKSGGYTGSGSLSYPFQFGNPQGISGTFAKAKTNVSSSQGKQPTMARRTKYGYGTIDGVALEASKGDAGAYVELVSDTVTNTLDEFGDRQAFDLFRDQYAARGRRSSISTNVVTLTEPNDARNFKKGMTVIADDDSTGASPRSGSTTVDKVDIQAGTVTLTSAAAITAFADNDYLFVDGEEGVAWDGLASHIPLTTPSVGESFRGIDRSDMPNLLAGVRLDQATTSTMEEDLARLAVDIYAEGRGKGQMSAWCNPLAWYEMSRRRNASVQIDNRKDGTYRYSYQYLEIATVLGILKLYPDPNCPQNRAYILRLDKWQIKTLLDLVHIIKADGLTELRVADEDAIEFRVRSIGNVRTFTPGDNGVISVAT